MYDIFIANWIDANFGFSLIKFGRERDFCQFEWYFRWFYRNVCIVCLTKGVFTCVMLCSVLSIFECVCVCIVITYVILHEYLTHFDIFRISVFPNNFQCQMSIDSPMIDINNKYIWKLCHNFHFLQLNRSPIYPTVKLSTTSTLNHFTTIKFAFGLLSVCMRKGERERE